MPEIIILAITIGMETVVGVASWFTAMDASTFLSDWETYFEEVHRFISSLGGGRMSFANELYTEFVLERLSNCVRSLTTLTSVCPRQQ